MQSTEIDVEMERWDGKREGKGRLARLPSSDLNRIPEMSEMRGWTLLSGIKGERVKQQLFEAIFKIT